MSDSNTEYEKIEEDLFQAEIIHTFEFRGWALYCVENISFVQPYVDLEVLKFIVELGREKEKLKIDVPYILLPLAEDDKNWVVVSMLVKEMMNQNSGPYFIDMDIELSNDGSYKANPFAVYFIDSVVLSPPFIDLVIYPEMSKVRDFSKVKPGATAVSIHLTELDKIKRQLKLSLRAKS